MLADCGYVVVVDDDPSLRQMVIKYLEDKQCPYEICVKQDRVQSPFCGDAS